MSNSVGKFRFQIQLTTWTIFSVLLLHMCLLYAPTGTLKRAGKFASSKIICWRNMQVFDFMTAALKIMQISSK